MRLSALPCDKSPASGLADGKVGAIIAPIFFLVKPMTQEPSTLYAKLLGETASITWTELQPFFAKGALLWVELPLDLIEVAEAVAENDAARVAAWLTDGQVGKVSENKALELVETDPALWAVVVAPWVLIQNRARD
ncbi:hypothetical protein ALO80_100198 [Pseudomonas caricapapayae]|uniref:DUF2288 domain-containing protein n=2 Tax=Pseudomonas caricapapayae TaxID=46678 RepID=A0A0P9KDK6_9PSED|nr:hypothetical protein ALO80_100198 [Pseudomonas caricapapayae]RMM09055.1 hypothetical protein ALQ84_100196 [Pseudomonas caricapapayae]RMV94049.1 hypothetical protein ALP01_05104 [Pseudomonas caricapapayae]